MSAIPVDRNIKLDAKMADSLLAVNRMLYKMPPSISIANSRHYQTGFPQQSSYVQSNTVVFDSQTGQSFVDGRTSYLKFEVKTVGVGDFGQGSACALIDRVLIRSRQGKELTRLEGAGLLTSVTDRWSKSKDWFDTVAPSQGYPYAAGDVKAYSQGDGTGNFTEGGVTFIIPLKKFPFFDQGKLLPPQIMEGLRIELSLASPEQAFVGAVTSYVLSNIQIKWDVYDISDQFKRKILEISTRQGLNLVHKEYYRTLVSAASNSFDFDIKKAASKALKVITVSRPTADLNNIASDEYKSEPYKYTRQQYHVGSVYFPNSPLETEATDKNAKESYHWVLSSMGNLEPRMAPSISSKEYFDSFAVSTASLNKSQTSDIQGTILNNSRALLAELRFSDATSRRLDSYLCHVRAVKIFPSNVVVRD